MKKNSFNKLITLSVSLALVAPSIVYGGIKGTRTPSSPSSGGVSSPGGSGNRAGNVESGNVTNVEDKSNPRDVNAGTICSKDQNESKLLPINFLSQLTRDGVSPTLELRDNNKIMVKFPAIITTCGKAIIKPQQDPTSQNVTVMFSMEKDGVEQTYKQIIDCLSTSNNGEPPMLKDGEINHDNIKAKNYAEYFYTFDYEFNKSTDIGKTLKLSAGYPTAFDDKKIGYPATFGIDNKVALPDFSCVKAEKIASEPTYLNRGRDVLIEDIRNKCLTGKTDEILKARKSLGNADALKDIADVIRGKLDSAYLEAAKPEVDAIYKQMKDLETKMNKGTKDIDEKTAKGYITKYSELAKKLDDLYLNPAVYRLDGLMTKYTDSTDDAEKTKLNEEIKKLNTNIGKFAARDSVSMINLYGLMEKFSTNDEAKIIEDVRLRSSLYAKVYPDSDTKDRGYTIESANQKQITTLKKFDRILTDWSDVYLAGHGSTAPIIKVNREMEMINKNAITHANNFQQSENKKYSQYCSVGMTGAVQNPIQCNAFVQGAPQRQAIEKRRIDAAAAQIATRKAKMDKMTGTYNAYEKARMEKASQDGDLTPYGNGYFTADGTFDELNPPYEAASTPIAYNPNTYQMGVPNQFNAYQPAPQYMQAQQPGQYQMYPMRQY